MGIAQCIAVLSARGPEFESQCEYSSVYSGTIFLSRGPEFMGNFKFFENLHNS